MRSVMKNIALIANVLLLSGASAFAQNQTQASTVDARLTAHQLKINQLERELIILKSQFTPPSKTAETTASSVPVAKKAPVTNSASYTVVKGDSLSKIAKKHNTTVKALTKTNKLKSDRIAIGQTLTLPGTHTAQASTAPQATPKPAAKALPKAGKYTTQQGETFYSIARKHNISTESLIAANPKVSPYKLRTGQVLTIDGSAKAKKPAASAKAVAKAAPQKAPVKKAPAKKTPVKKAVAKSAPTPKKKEVASAPSKPSKSTIRTITVYEQMTYGQFASKHGASTKQLNALNGLSLSNNTVLAKGSELYVPKY